jgi:hypothetical protein
VQAERCADADHAALRLGGADPRERFERGKGERDARRPQEAPPRHAHAPFLYFGQEDPTLHDLVDQGAEPVLLLPDRRDEGVDLRASDLAGAAPVA